MKLFSRIAAVAVLVSLLLLGSAPAQTAAWSGSVYTCLNAATSTGAGTVYSLTPAVHSYTMSVATSGTVTAATVNLEGSLDNVHWYPLGVAASTDANWSSGEMIHVAFKPVNYIRANLVSISGGGSITATVSIYQ